MFDGNMDSWMTSQVYSQHSPFIKSPLKNVIDSVTLL